MLFAGNTGQPPIDGPLELAGVAVGVDVRVGVAGARVAVAVLDAMTAGVMVAVGIVVTVAVRVALATGLDVAVAVRVNVAVRVGVRRFGAALAELSGRTRTRQVDKSCKASAMKMRWKRFIDTSLTGCVRA
jgi:hypothetical protein